ncbi:unnamed protein product [Sphagnum jensenii]|uniref:RRM domain-containing protein n=1 Tax=Sphagnum jensenii TaxID=128206 RepID=A0ABP0W0B4_9BRYO
MSRAFFGSLERGVGMEEAESKEEGSEDTTEVEPACCWNQNQTMDKEMARSHGFGFVSFKAEAPDAWERFYVVQSQQAKHSLRLVPFGVGIGMVQVVLSEMTMRMVGAMVESGEAVVVV